MEKVILYTPPSNPQLVEKIIQGQTTSTPDPEEEDDERKGEPPQPYKPTWLNELPSVSEVVQVKFPEL